MLLVFMMMGGHLALLVRESETSSPSFTCHFLSDRKRVIHP